MIITGVFLVLLGTTLGTPTKTEVRYEGPNHITVSESMDDCISLPGLGSPPFAPSFFHQGSNFYFNPQIVMPVEGIETGMERMMVPFKPVKEVTIFNTDLKTKEIIEEVEFVVPELPSVVIPKIEIEEPILTIPEIIENVEFLVPGLPSFFNPKIEIEEPIQTISQVVEIDRIPMELPLPVLPVEIVREEPCVDIQIENIMPNVPILIEEPVRLTKIPPAPELPPLILSEVQASIIQENKKVILVPSAPELTMAYPPSIMIENPLFPTECAQNIVFERILPNMAFEYGKTLELISIPATKRAPVVSSIIF